jgi:hypothetical protein
MQPTPFAIRRHRAITCRISRIRTAIATHQYIIAKTTTQ